MKTLSLFFLVSVMSLSVFSAEELTSKTACFKVEGMTCTTCSTTLKISIKKLKGIIKIKASADKGSAKVNYDPAVVDANTIKKNIISVGYKAIEITCPKKG